jgi:hypothetical protein
MSFIPQLQNHVIKLKDDIEMLKVLRYSLNGFSSSDEYEAASQMTAIREMQLEAGIRALTFF